MHHYKGNVVRASACKAVQVLITAVLMIAAEARADGPAGMPPIPIDQAIRLRISPQHYQDLIVPLNLSEAQRRQADQVYDRYRSDIEALYHQVRDRVNEDFVVHLADEQAPLDEAGLERFGRERAARMMDLLTEHVQWGTSRAKSRLAEFEASMTAMLAEPQLKDWPRALRRWRRQLILDAEQSSNDFHRIPDMTVLYELACKEGEEFAGLSAAGSGDDDQLQTAVNEITAILASYEEELDAMLMRSLDSRWLAHQRMIAAHIRNDAASTATHHRRWIGHWKEQFALTQRVAASIGAAVEPALGASAQRRWMDRWWKGMFPELLATDSAEIMFQWLIEHDEIAAEQRSDIERVYDEYQRQRHGLWNEAVRAYAKIYASQHPVLGNQETLSLEALTPRDLQPIEKRRAALAAQVNANFRSLLPPDLKEVFDSRLSRIVKSAHNGYLVRY